VANEHSEPQIEPRPEKSHGPAEASRVIRSEELFAGGRTVVIQHADVQYRLLITRNDRLILQK
jgi:hemin uptake protein HemP